VVGDREKWWEIEIAEINFQVSSNLGEFVD
jgi:hypothetical protein